MIRIAAVLAAVLLVTLLSARPTHAQSEDQLQAALLTPEELGGGFRLVSDEGTAPGDRVPNVTRTFFRDQPAIENVLILLASGPVAPVFNAVRDLAQEAATGAPSTSGSALQADAPGIGSESARFTFITTISGATFTGDVIGWRSGTVTAIIVTLGTGRPGGIAYARTQEAKIARQIAGAPGTAPVGGPPAAAPQVFQPGGPPTDPTNLRVTVGGATALAFAWTPSAGADFYWVYAPYDGGYTQVRADMSSFALSSLVPGSYHCLIVIAQNAAGYSGWSNWSCANTSTPPPPPTMMPPISPPPVGAPPTVRPLPVATATPAPSRAGCSPAYPTVCIPPPPPDLDCGDIPFRNFAVLPPDPHRFDGNNDGVGCET